MKLNSTPSERSARMRSFPFGPPSLLALLLGLLTIIVFWPVTNNEFVNYDDNDYVYANTQVQKGLTLANLGWAFTHTVSCNWHPLTMMSHMLDCQLYGLNPWGHHLTSLLFHAANAVLLFIFLHRLTGAVWRSAWVAAVFALHPMHVESVAWLAERKDVLSAFFGFLTLLFYLRYVRKLAPAGAPSDRSFLRSPDYWLGCFCFALGLLSKPMLVTWPFVLLLLDFWPLARFQIRGIRALVIEKLPFFALAMTGSIVTFLVQKQGGATQTLLNLPFLLRCANAVIAYGRYLVKLICPTDLSIFYPYPKVMIVSTMLVVALILGAISALFWSQRRRYPFLLMGWLWFFGTLVPVIGLVQVGSQSMADRYSYIPSVGILILVGWGAFALSRRRTGLAVVLSLMAIGTVALCTKATRQQIAIWKTSKTLFEHSIKVTADNFVAQNNLAVAYLVDGRTNDAMNGFRESLRIYPGYAVPHLSLGNILASKGLTNEAVSELQAALKIDSHYTNAQVDLGILLVKMGRTNEGVSQIKMAIQFQTNIPGSFNLLAGLLIKHAQTNTALDQLQEAVKIAPLDPAIQYQLGMLLLHSPKTDDAISHFQEAIRLKPDLFEAHNDLSGLLAGKGQVDQAIGELQESIRLKPDYADAHYNLGALYLKKGLGDEAAGEFQTVIRLTPDSAPARYYLGTILLRKSQTDAAAAQFQEAVRLKPDYAFAHNKLGIALGTMGHLAEAITEFQAAVRLRPDYAEANTNLAIALKMQGSAGH